MAKISNSAYVAFCKCPQLYTEEFVNGIQKPKPYLDFGHRFHDLLHKHYYPEYNLLDSTLPETQEAEVQSMFEAYKAYYPAEDFEVVDCEHRFELGFGDLYTEDLILAEGEDLNPAVHYSAFQHTYLGKFDMLVRNKDGKLQLFETKTEARGSKRNLPKAWVARTQASLYLWAAEQIYKEPIDSIILNVCIKASPKGQVSPTFRRDTLQRTPAQVKQAISDLTYIANQIDQIGTGPFPRHTNNCISENGWECDYFLRCHYGAYGVEEQGFVQIEPFSYLAL